ncbi:RNase H family protein [Curtobacterium citreum]
MPTSDLLVVATDASIAPRTGVAGFAWADTDAGWGAACAWPPSDNITVPESLAILTAVTTAPMGRPLHIVTDSQASLEQLRMAAAGTRRRDSRPARTADLTVAAAQARTEETVIHWVRGHTQTVGVTVLHRQVDGAARRAARRVSADPAWYDRTTQHITAAAEAAVAGQNSGDCDCGWVEPTTSLGEAYPSDPSTWTLRVRPGAVS